jgi:hypothetical protein
LLWSGQSGQQMKGVWRASIAASLHLVDKARGCLGDATTTKPRARDALLPSLSHVPTHSRGNRVGLPHALGGRKARQPQPNDRMGPPLHTGVLRVDFQAAPWSPWRAPGLDCLPRGSISLLESKSASLGGEAGIGSRATPCFGAWVNNPSSLMQSWHCLERLGCCTCLLAAGAAQAADAAAQTSSFTSLNPGTKVGGGQLPLSHDVPSRWRWLPHALPCA